jgi:hypothetical protein
MKIEADNFRYRFQCDAVSSATDPNQSSKMEAANYNPAKVKALALGAKLELAPIIQKHQMFNLRRDQTDS